MTVYLSIHLSKVTYSRRVLPMPGDPFGVLYLDEAHDVAISGDERQLRAMADVLLELADDVAFEATRGEFRLSPAEVRRQEETRQAQRLSLLAQKLERVGGDDL